jgi:hypothetical protein
VGVVARRATAIDVAAVTIGFKTVQSARTKVVATTMVVAMDIIINPKQIWQWLLPM